MNIKAKGSIISTKAGIKIDFSDKQSENACSSIRRRFELDSSVNSEREEQESKHDLQNTSTEAGRQIDFSDEQPENASSSI
jgi:hypothetical protein